VLAQAGYATDPAYSDKVIGLIKQHNLLALDGGAP
jgi:flagellum-specific peptidoglycan hydrolase FlgJ